MNTNTRNAFTRAGAGAGVVALCAALTLGAASSASAAAPTVGADFYAVTANTPLSISAGAGLFANDADPDGDAFTIHSISPNSAVLSGEGFNPGADGSFVYTPPTGYTGTREWSYRIEDASEASELAVITFTITAPPVVNTKPVANPDAYAVTQGVLLVVPASAGVIANDTDADGDALTISSGLLAPAGGILPGESAGLWSDGKFTYLPPTGFTGTRTWTYSITDGTAFSAFTTVVFTITAPVPAGNVSPAGGADNYGLAQDGWVNVPAPGVLANDTDADGDALTLVAQGSDEAGLTGEALTTWADGKVFYHAPTGFVGTRTFWYEVSDGTHTVRVPLVFTMTPAPVGNVAPVVGDDDYAIPAAPFDTTGPGLFVNDSDADGDSFTVAKLTTQGGPLAGESFVVDADGAIHYVPPTGYTGVRSWRYTVSDGFAESDWAQVTFTISAAPVVNVAPLANPDTYAVIQDVPVAHVAPGFLANDTDADGDTLDYDSITAPAGGMLPGESLNANANGSFGYTPPTGFVGDRVFTYVASDGTTTSNATTLTFQITAPPLVNVAPVAVADAYPVVQDTKLVVASPGLLANDVDANGDPIAPSWTWEPAGGKLPGEVFVLTSSGGSFEYTPPTGFTGTRVFEYTIHDATLESAHATVTFTVAAASIPTLPTDLGTPAGSTPGGSTTGGGDGGSLAATGADGAGLAGTAALAGLLLGGGMIARKFTRREA